MILNQSKNENLTNPSQAISDNNSGHIEFDGDETVNCYSKIATVQKTQIDKTSSSNGTGGVDTSPNKVNSNNNSGSGQQNSTNSNQPQQSNLNDNPSSGKDGNLYDLTMRLRYLEKSIKFIQQQHNETLSCLHQEIEKLKNENRGTFDTVPLKINTRDT